MKRKKRASIDIYKDKSNEWMWRLKAPNGKIIATGAEGYSSRSKCVKGLFATQRYIWSVPVPRKEVTNHV